MTYTYGDRSAIWYKPSQLEKAGVEPSGDLGRIRCQLRQAEGGRDTPCRLRFGAKYWSHTEWFETLLMRTAGVETASKLAAHEIPWTDPAVKTALKKYAEMLEGGLLRRRPKRMFANDWDGAADLVFKAGPSRTTRSLACG